MGIGKGWKWVKELRVTSLRAIQEFKETLNMAPVI
jgi:hypothetical protein